MGKVIYKRGKKEAIEQQPLVDGTLSFSVDDGKIHLDYVENGELKRRTFYSGKLTFGSHIYDGSEDVNVDVYDGELEDKN